jgi:maltooligosyltrehalose trehalohydrolase
MTLQRPAAISDRFELSHGATLLAPDRARFRFWAPDIAAVALEIEGRAPLSMKPEPGGWHGLEAECGDGTRYRYRIRPDLAVPDPASRAQHDDVSGWSVVVDPAAYRWCNGGWQGRPWRDAILYEVHPGLAGGFAGLREKLPKLAELGITAIELMPIADFPGGRNWGYDGVLPFAPDASYGTPGELKELIDRAHDLGLMMFQDVVYNHFGPEGNYLGAYASGFFQADVHTPWGAAIDFRNPVVRRFFIENAVYWLKEYRFDGLRFDAVHAIFERDWLIELAQTVRSEIGERREVHLVLENDNNDAALLEAGFTAQWNDDAHHAAHVLITGEVEGYYSDYVGNPAAAMARSLAEGFAFQGDASAYRNGAPRGSPSGHLPPTSFVFFLQNHDQIGNRALGERLTSLADADTLRVGVALLLLAPQIPLIFMGEEQGERTPFLYFTDYEGELAEAVRNGRRKEFGKFAAFATPEAQRRIPDPNHGATYENSRPRFGAKDDAAQEWSEFYRRLIALRRETLVPHLDGARALDAEPLNERALVARWSLGNGATWTLAANFGDAPVATAQLAGQPIFRCGSTGVSQGELPAKSLAALLEPQK